MRLLENAVATVSPFVTHHQGESYWAITTPTREVAQVACEQPSRMACVSQLVESDCLHTGSQRALLV